MQPYTQTATDYNLADTAPEELKQQAFELMTRLTDEQLMMALAIAFKKD